MSTRFRLGASFLYRSRFRREYQGMKITFRDLRDRLKLPSDKASKVLALIEGNDSPDDYKSVQDNQYITDAGDKMMIALNELLNGFGVEGITPDGEIYPVAEYVNNGDSYEPTIVRDLNTGEFLLCGWGDFLEEWENDNREEDEGETEEDDEGGGECSVCGKPFTVDANGVATHDSDTEPSGVDHDADEDHVPYA